MSRLLLLLLGLLVGACACEAAIAVLYFRPAYCPRAFMAGLKSLYMRDRNIVQFEPDCVRYDATLGYTLKPGSCRFKNVEFDTEIKINRLGLRDSELALVKPAIIVLGDSIAMGWGVADDQTLSRVLEKKTGLRALNAAIAGYGTVRELRLLRRIDVSAMRYLIVYYCDNDYDDENEAFDRLGELPISPRAEFDARQQLQYIASRRYFPGKFLWQLGRAHWPTPRDVAALKPAPRISPSEAFLNALRRANPEVPVKTNLIVLTYNPPFAAELKRNAGTSRYPAWIRGMTVIDVSRLLGASSHFLLDEHPKADGHAAVATAVVEALGIRRYFLTQ